MKLFNRKTKSLAILDRYIMSKFLGTFFFGMLMIMAIVVVFDFNEHLDNFVSHHAPAKAIIFDFYFNFIPYFALKFSPLFVFISVIYFTGKLAADSEIIAMLAGGVSFHRLVRPYMISAIMLGTMIFLLSSFWLPNANVDRLNFKNKYIKTVKSSYTSNIQMAINPGEIMYIGRYNNGSKRGYDFFLEKFEGQRLVSRTTATSVKYDSINHWTIYNYLKRDFIGMKEKVSSGTKIDTVLNVNPEEFFIVKGYSEQFTTPALKRYLDKQRERGVANIKEYEIEYYKRFSFPFSCLILTIIGVSLASQKLKGGMGLQLGLGLALSFSYILFDTVSSSFVNGGLISPLVAVWIPNIIYAIIAIFLYIKAPK